MRFASAPSWRRYSLSLVWGPWRLDRQARPAFLVIQGVTILAVALWAVRWWVQRPFRSLLAPGLLGSPGISFVRGAALPVGGHRVRSGTKQLTRSIGVRGAVFCHTQQSKPQRVGHDRCHDPGGSPGFSIAFLAVVQFFRHTPLIWGVAKPAQYIARGSGTFFNPNNFSAYLEMIIPLALAYTIMSRFGATIKVLLAYAALVMMAGVWFRSHAAESWPWL